MRCTIDKSQFFEGTSDKIPIINYVLVNEVIMLLIASILLFKLIQLLNTTSVNGYLQHLPKIGANYYLQQFYFFPILVTYFC